MEIEETSKLFMKALADNVPISKTDKAGHFEYIYEKKNDISKHKQILNLVKSSFTHAFFYLAKETPNLTLDNMLSSYVLVSCTDDFMENYYPKLAQKQNGDLAKFLTKCPQNMLVFFEPEIKYGLKIDYVMPISIPGFGPYNNLNKGAHSVWASRLQKLHIQQITCQQMQQLYQYTNDPYLIYGFDLISTNNDEDDDFYMFRNVLNASSLTDNWAIINNAINYWFSQHMQLKCNTNLASHYEFVIKSKNPFYQKLAQKLTNALSADLVSNNSTHSFVDFMQLRISYVQWNSDDNHLFYINPNDDDISLDEIKANLTKSAAESKLKPLKDAFCKDRFMTSNTSALAIVKEIPAFKPYNNIVSQKDSLCIKTPNYNTFAEVDPQEKHSLSGIFDSMEMLGKKEKIFIADHQLNVLIGRTNIKNIISKEL